MLGGVSNFDLMTRIAMHLFRRYRFFNIAYPVALLIFSRLDRGMNIIKSDHGKKKGTGRLMRFASSRVKIFSSSAHPKDEKNSNQRST
jgi:hypothetical protein